MLMSMIGNVPVVNRTAFDRGVGGQIATADFAERGVEHWKLVAGSALSEKVTSISALPRVVVDRTSGHADDTVGGFFQWPGHRDQHLLGGQIAAIGHDGRAIESYFGKYRTRDHAREDYSEHACREHRDQRERRGAPSQFRTPGFVPPVFWSPATRTSSPSDNAYPPEVTTSSPALTPAIT